MLLFTFHPPTASLELAALLPCKGEMFQSRRAIRRTLQRPLLLSWSIGAPVCSFFSAPNTTIRLSPYKLGRSRSYYTIFALRWMTRCAGPIFYSSSARGFILSAAGQICVAVSLPARSEKLEHPVKFLARKPWTRMKFIYLFIRYIPLFVQMWVQYSHPMPLLIGSEVRSFP